MIKIIFYKAEKGDIVDKMISFYTCGKYSHCELVFENDLCFSSSPRDGNTRFKNINIYSNKWDIFYLRNLNDEKIYNFCKLQEGKRYDWVGIFLSQIVPLNIQEPNKWFCSEICYAALLQGGFPKLFKNTNINPNRLSILINCYIINNMVVC